MDEEKKWEEEKSEALTKSRKIFVPESSLPTDKIKSALSWDEYYLNLAFSASLRSKDPSTKVGSVVVKGTSLVTGYNGFPIGVKDTKERWERPIKYKFVVHAERNALSNAQFDVSGGTIYITHNQPCNECTKSIIQHRISRVVCGSLAASNMTSEQSDKSFLMLAEAGIGVDIIDAIALREKVMQIMARHIGKNNL
jgi:dCMP deaminase